MRPVLASLALITACATATPYQPMGYRGGYAEQKIDDSTYVVDVRVNARTSPATALAYFHRRASEVCKAQGFAGYRVMETQTNDRTSATTTVNSYGGPLVASTSVQKRPEQYGRIRCTNTGG